MRHAGWPITFPQHNARRRPREAGFTLVELSIFLLIVSILAGSALMFGTGQQGFARQKQTYDKMKLIENALAAYAKLNGRLPCPANGALARMDANLGNEERDTTTGQCNNVTRVNIGGAPDPDMFVGTVPTDALNISDEFMFDGWDRRFVYAVDERFTSRLTFFAVQEDDANYAAGSFQRDFIQIVDGITPANVRSRWAVYVLMSAGEDGIGAWTREGGARIAGAMTDLGEINNQNWGDKIFAVTLRSTTFNDIVHYRKKDMLLADAGVILGGKTRRVTGVEAPLDDCSLAQRTLMPISFPNATVACSSATPPAGCLPLEGPAGCEDEAGVEAMNPAYIGTDGTVTPNRKYVRPQLDAIYTTLPRHGDCLNRQIRLAETIHARCLYY